MHDILSDSTDANFIGFRQMTKDDILNVLSLMEPFINRGILLPRTENSLLEKLNDYVVYQIDGGIHACAALHIYNSIEGEIAAVAVDALIQLLEVLNGKARRNAQRNGHITNNEPPAEPSNVSTFGHATYSMHSDFPRHQASTLETNRTRLPN